MNCLFFGHSLPAFYNDHNSVFLVNPTDGFVEIDKNIVSIMTKLWSLGIQTNWSCGGGGLFSGKTKSYITFPRKDWEKVKARIKEIPSWLTVEKEIIVSPAGLIFTGTEKQIEKAKKKYFSSDRFQIQRTIRFSPAKVNELEAILFKEKKQ